MKHLLINFLSLMLLGSLFIQCSEEQSPTAANDETNTSLDKVTIIEDTFDYNYEGSLPYEDCVTGAQMLNYGIIKAYYRAIITPSGKYIESGHVDYNAYGEVTLENLSTGEIWTLQNGTNPWIYIEHQNGGVLLHYLWQEVYKSGNQVLNLHLQGFFTINPNGIITKNLETYFCN